jgi:hypothetical protein
VLPRLTGLRPADLAGPAVTLAPPVENRSGQAGDMTQPMRIPTGTISAAERRAAESAVKAAEKAAKAADKAKVRPRTAEAVAAGDEVTAVLDMSGLPKKDGDGK